MVGSSILEALEQTDQYNITILTRSTKGRQFPQTVTAVEVDYASFDSLVQALQGQEVLICALGKFALGSERLIIDAAFTAKVKRLIPSEFGGNLLNFKTRVLPNYKHKVDNQERLFELCHDQNGSTMTYTLVFTNVLLDWCLSSGLILDLKKRELRKYDQGDTLFSATRVCTIGLAVVGILQNYNTTANRAVYVQDIAITQNELLSLVQEEDAKIVGSQLQHSRDTTTKRSSPLVSSGHVLRPLKVTHIDTASLETEARESIARGAALDTLFNCFAARAAFGKEHGGYFERNDNDLLGLKGLSREGLRQVIREVLSGGTI
jgi:hypothetical protein